MIRMIEREENAHDKTTATLFDRSNNVAYKLEYDKYGNHYLIISSTDTPESGGVVINGDSALQFWSQLPENIACDKRDLNFIDNVLSEAFMMLSSSYLHVYRNRDDYKAGTAVIVRLLTTIKGRGPVELLPGTMLYCLIGDDETSQPVYVDVLGDYLPITNRNEQHEYEIVSRYSEQTKHE